MQVGSICSTGGATQNMCVASICSTLAKISSGGEAVSSVNRHRTCEPTKPCPTRLTLSGSLQKLLIGHA